MSMETCPVLACFSLLITCAGSLRRGRGVARERVGVALVNACRWACHQWMANASRYPSISTSIDLAGLHITSKPLPSRNHLSDLVNPVKSLLHLQLPSPNQWKNGANHSNPSLQPSKSRRMPLKSAPSKENRERIPLKSAPSKENWEQIPFFQFYGHLFWWANI